MVGELSPHIRIVENLDLLDGAILAIDIIELGVKRLNHASIDLVVLFELLVDLWSAFDLFY